MDLYVVINTIDQLLIHRQWKLNRCRRQAGDALHYYVTDTEKQVVTPKDRGRAGLSIVELLLWMEVNGDSVLSESVRSIRYQVVDVW